MQPQTPPDQDTCNEAAFGKHGFFEKRGRVGVLMIHGLSGTPTEMRGLGRSLAARGLSVGCPELAGHCGSVSMLKTSRWRDWCRSVERAFEAMEQECDAVFIAGFSAGALIGLILAAKLRERVAGIALISTTFFLDGWNMRDWKKQLILRTVIYSPLRHVVAFREPPPYGIKDERMRNKLVSVLEARDSRTADKIGHFSVPATVFRERARLSRKAARVLPTVSCPSLLVHSTEDDFASMKNVDFAAQRLGSRHVESYVVDDSYHVLPLDKRRHDVAERIAAFCLSVGGHPAQPAGA